jgi:hypothetical protein
MRFPRIPSQARKIGGADQWLFMGAIIKPGAGSVESVDKCSRGILAVCARGTNNVRASAYIHSHSFVYATASRISGAKPDKSLLVVNRSLAVIGCPNIRLPVRLSQAKLAQFFPVARDSSCPTPPDKLAGIMNSSQAISRMRQVIRRQHKALSTEKSYIFWLRQYIDSLRSTPNDLSSEKKLELFLTSLARQRDVAASTQNQAFNAIRISISNGPVFASEGQKGGMTVWFLCPVV